MDTPTSLLSLLPNIEHKRLEFAYDAVGRRVEKKVYVWNLTTVSYGLVSDRRFVYDGWNLAVEYDLLASNQQRSYVWGMDLSGSLGGAGGVGGLLAASSSTATAYAAYDGNGNVTFLADATTGQRVAEYEYGPFGETIQNLDFSGLANPFQFSSKYLDPEGGLLYYGLRYCNPGTGRWLSREPMGEPESPNLYGFVSNHPTNSFDVNGLYDSVGHFYTSYLVARAAGYGPDDAFQFAYWSQYPDLDPKYDAIKSGSLDVQQYLHSLTGGDPIKLRNYLGCLLKSDQFSAAEKGILAHGFGDAYAHSYQVPFSKRQRLYSPGIGHFFSGHLPDYIASNPGKYGEYTNQLYGILSSTNSDPNAVMHPEYITGLQNAANGLPKPYLADFFFNGTQDTVEAEVLRNLPGGYNGPFTPESSKDPLPGMTQPAELMQGLIDKIKNGVAGCCPQK
jgi:RHS repeat-associated protein